jgi:hypothetical protein
MRLHIGRARTKRTRCGKPVARCWWVEDAHKRYGVGPGYLQVYEDVKPTGATCAECLKAPEMAT